MTTTTIDDFLTSDRVRFNYGYHDGAQHQRMNGEGASLHERNGVSDADHFDQVWIRGFLAGRQDVRLGHNTDDSTEAWEYYGAEACGMTSIFRKPDSTAPKPGHRIGVGMNGSECECCLKQLG
jgi:hypothetical protein